MRTRRSGGTCEFCGNSYSKKEHYERHIRTHTREKPFACSICSATFSRRDTLRRHHRACHEESPQVTRIENASVSGNQHHEPSIANDLTPAHINTDAAFLGTPPESATFASISPLCNPGLASIFGDFDWQWDDSLNLDSSFSLEDLGTYDLNFANPSTPWIPLRRPAENATQQSWPPKTLRPPSELSRSWFTNLSRTRYSSPRLSALTDASTLSDEQFSRDALANSLQQKVPDTALPPTPFLNRCIHAFMTRLWPLIPIIHLPTFHPAQTNPLLLLSICSLGALADGSRDAVSYSERLYEGVQKAILVSFSFDKGADEHTLAILQAAAIGQTYALLCGKTSHLLMAQSFHGTLSVAVRAFHDHDSGSNPVRSPNLSSINPSSEDWHQWVRTQTILRLLNAVYVHNGEVFAAVQEPAPLRAHPLKIRLAASDNLYLAKSAHEWATLTARLTPNQLHLPALFSACATLECFIAEIGHCRAGPFSCMDDHRTDEIRKSLVTWFQGSAELLATEASHRLAVLMLWHSCFVLLLSDVNMMERACGRDGITTSDDDTRSLHSWAYSENAKVAIWHSLLIFRLLERFHVSEAPAIHVARAAWHAGLVLAMYSFFAPADEAPNAPDVPESRIELQTVREAGFFTESDWASVKDDAAPGRGKAAAYSLSTTLRHLGPWRNASRYAETLDQVLRLVESSQC